MEDIVQCVNRSEEGGEGLADEYIEKYARSRIDSSEGQYTPEEPAEKPVEEPVEKAAEEPSEEAAEEPSEEAAEESAEEAAEEKGIAEAAAAAADQVGEEVSPDEE